MMRISEIIRNFAAEKSVICIIWHTTIGCQYKK